MTQPHYRLSNTDTIDHLGHTLRRVISTGFGGIGQPDGFLGGYVETEFNLVQGSRAWVGEQARVWDDARISESAHVTENAHVHGSAVISGNCVLYGNVSVSGRVNLSGDVRLRGNAVITQQPMIVRRSDGYDFVLTLCGDGVYRIIAGCRYFTFEQARSHWNKHNRKSYQPDLHRETMAILRAFEIIAQRPLRARIRDYFR